MPLKRRETSDTVNRGSTPSSAGTFLHSAEISPEPNLSRTTPSILPCTSTSMDKQIQHASDNCAVALRNTLNKYTYSKLSELLKPEKKVNMYGVIHAIIKVKLTVNLTYIVCSY
jgi:hypothetical protein